MINRFQNTQSCLVSKNTHETQYHDSRVYQLSLVIEMYDYNFNLSVRAKFLCVNQRCPQIFFRMIKWVNFATTHEKYKSFQFETPYCKAAQKVICKLNIIWVVYDGKRQYDCTICVLLNQSRYGKLENVMFSRQKRYFRKRLEI